MNVKVMRWTQRWLYSLQGQWPFEPEDPVPTEETPVPVMPYFAPAATNANAKARAAFLKVMQPYGISPRAGMSYPTLQPIAGAPPREDYKIEQVTSEILAWRAWSLDGDDAEPLLRSMTFTQYTWMGPTMTAHQLPDGELTDRGVHAVKDPASHWLETSPVIGQVALHGRVVIGTEGYRAEKATIRSLTLRFPESWGGWQDRYCALELASILEERYRVDVAYDPTPCDGAKMFSRGALQQLLTAQAGLSTAAMGMPQQQQGLLSGNQFGPR